MEIVQNPNDKIFKQVFNVRENAVSLLRNILPPEIHKDLDFDGLYFENDSYVSRDFAEYYSDVLTSVPVAGSEQYAFNESVKALLTLDVLLKIGQNVRI